MNYLNSYLGISNVIFLDFLNTNDYINILK
jgi:hypothetical protein